MGKIVNGRKPYFFANATITKEAHESRPQEDLNFHQLKEQVGT